MPDNFVQDPYNTQNFNRYGYVLNNPLMYVDPSGEYAETAGDSSEFEGAGWANAIANILSNFDSIKGWVNGWWPDARNWIGSQAKSVGDAIARPFRETGRFFKRLFGGGRDRAPSPEVQMFEIPGNMSPSVPTNLFIFGPTGGGGMNTGTNGIRGASGRINGLIYSAFAFQTGYIAGLVSGVNSTWDFIESLTTTQGWKGLGQGFMDLAAMGSTIPTAEGMMLRAQLGQSIENYVTNIPNMSAYEIGQDLGFASEKVAEIAITRRVMPIPKSALGLPTLGRASEFTTIQSLRTYGKWGRFIRRRYTWPTGGYTLDKATYYNRNYIIPIGRLIGFGQLQYIQD